MKAIIINQHFPSADELQLSISDVEKPIPKQGECLVQISASGVNPSDALGAIGYFSHASLPRIPGRDFSGVVVEGSSQHIGKKIWGTGGAAGLDFNGCHGEYMVLSESAIAEIPNNLSLIEAGAQPLPYTTAYYSLLSRAHIQAGEKVLIIGGLGQVGRAALSICKWKKCDPVALVRDEEDIEKANALGWNATTTIDSKYDVILNTIGNVNWDSQVKALKKFGRIAVIAAPEGKRDATINLFNFYRANQEICGINTVDFNFEENGKMLSDLKEGFESGDLAPLPTNQEQTFPLAKATEAYKLVLEGSKGVRVLLSIN